LSGRKECGYELGRFVLRPLYQLSIKGFTLIIVFYSTIDGPRINTYPRKTLARLGRGSGCGENAYA
jgi:hypothetical protein